MTGPARDPKELDSLREDGLSEARREQFRASAAAVARWDDSRFA